MPSLDRSTTFFPDSQADEPDGGLGRLLRDARERRGVTLEQVAHEIKIPAHRLAVFDRDGMPAGESGFYARAQLRTYARAVGLDDRLVRTELSRVVVPPAPPPAVEISTGPSTGLRRTVIAIGGLVVLALIGRMIATQEGPRVSDMPVRDLTVAPLTQLLPPVENSFATATTWRDVQAEEASAWEAQPDPRQPQDVSARAAPAAAAVTTQLVISTEPEGARVTVSGVGWGTTPVTIRHLEAGDKRVRVTKEGYVAVERVVRLTTERPSRITIRLRPAEN